MKVIKLKLTDIRGFRDDNFIELSKKINLFVGQNNAGKSTVLNSILLIQNTEVLKPSDVNLQTRSGQIELVLDDIDKYIAKFGADIFKKSHLRKLVFSYDRVNNGIGRGLLSIDNNVNTTFKKIPESEPSNLIYPYLSKRKVVTYDESVNIGATNSVKGNFSNLYAKINRLCNVNHPNSQDYQDACKEIIGFPISPVASPSGQQGAYIIDAFSNILLTSMGEGVPNLLGLIVDLCIAEDKIFLIEEPENDIHPKALKSLLELIKQKSDTNQFFISTHSNIVTKYLGSVEDSKVFRVSMSFEKDNRIPISKIEEVENEPTARLRLLEELGYEPFDFSQWKAWLILEESSAEVIIRDFLIPTFVSNLKYKLRTYSAGSRDEVEPKFNDFKNLFVFVHLEEIYKNKAWVLIDAGEKEKEIIDRMKDTFSNSGWNEENFLQLTKHDFEEYYPDRFSNEVNEILALKDKKQKRTRKRLLVEKVKLWAKENPELAKEEFAESASDVIEILKAIRKQVDK